MQYYQKGFSLFEVLIALFLLMLCFLWLEKLTILSLKQMQAAWLETISSIQLQSMSAWLLINQGEALPFLLSWDQDNQILLPKGKGNVLKNKSITIEWQPSDLLHETQTLVI